LTQAPVDVRNDTRLHRQARLDISSPAGHRRLAGNGVPDMRLR